MSHRLLLRLAAALALLTCAGHTIGTLMAVPAEQTAMHEAIAVMKRTMVPMPVGQPRSYMEILDGNNICTSLFLLLCGALLIVISSSPRSAAMDRVTLVVSLALAGIAVISARFFFPVPAVFTALAAVLSFLASRQTRPA